MLSGNSTQVVANKAHKHALLEVIVFSVFDYDLTGGEVLLFPLNQHATSLSAGSGSNARVPQLSAKAPAAFPGS